MYSKRQKKRQQTASKKQKAQALSDFKKKSSQADYKKLNSAISKLIKKEYTWSQLYAYCNANLNYLTVEQIEEKVNEKIFKANQK